MSTDPRIAYVIVDWDTSALANACHDSIRRRRPDSEVVIVDAKELDLGYSAALNRGIRTLDRPDIVVALNADTEQIESDEPVLAMFDRDPLLAAVGPRQTNRDGLVVSGGIVPFEHGSEWDLELRHRCWLWPATDEPDDPSRVVMETPTIAGSVLYLRRAALEQLGGMPEQFRFFYEDTFFCYLARHRGWRTLYYGSNTWRHHLAGSPVDDGWRMLAMQTARDQFLFQCGLHGIPLRLPNVDRPDGRIDDYLAESAHLP